MIMTKSKGKPLSKERLKRLWLLWLLNSKGRYTMTVKKILNGLKKVSTPAYVFF